MKFTANLHGWNINVRQQWRNSFPIIVSAMLLGGCVTDDNIFSNLETNNLSWFNSAEPLASKGVVIAIDSNVLANGIEVEVAIVGVISLYRTINNQSLPVNAPDKFHQLKEEFFPTLSASK